MYCWWSVSSNLWLFMVMAEVENRRIMPMSTAEVENRRIMLMAMAQVGNSYTIFYNHNTKIMAQEVERTV
ncbi:hypothetical protein HYC85_027970 [Camellia sinensis]|uniref:Uncharacterized protein n=1 Tax=Camellia sinensis TaxID=4442 RepID=A0A7J7FU38_CAMSI|nr:hypothetical protein HYC85_027970 [Camellia sinensis]